MTVEEIEAMCAAETLPPFMPHPMDIGELPFQATFYPLGFPLQVRTNAEEVLEMTGRLWPEFSQEYDTAPMLSDVYVADGGPEKCPPTPIYHFQRPIITSIADAQHHIVIDKERRRTFTWITRASLKHPLYIEYFFLMMPMATMPTQVVHAACVALNGRGVLLCGDSGAGKSTLSYACARAGWDYISDDSCVLIDGEQRIVGGNCHRVRFRPNAAEFFPEVRGLDLTPRAAGKPSIELSMLSMTHVKRCPRTRIDFIVFLNRRVPEPPALLPYKKEVARHYMQQGLFATPQEELRHAECVEGMLAAEVLELRYSNLDWAIQRLCTLVEKGS